MQHVEKDLPVYCDPGAIAWNYTRTELIADLTIHVTGLCLGFIAAAILLAIAAIHAATTHIIGAWVYALSLLSMLACSAAYNLWPVCPMKWRLRRFDLSAIYILIAATYTPFVLDMRPGTLVITFLIGVWFLAALGAAIKFALPGRLDRLSIAVYLAMGWSGVILWSDKDALVPPAAFGLLTAGGVLLSIGVI